MPAPPAPVDECYAPRPAVKKVSRGSLAVKRFGLALSGGGFRATLYHLGLVRYLYDAGLLSSVSHITSVSGGSIIAAHLVLNWNRYNGSASEFDAAASELLAFVRLDVRNRIVRRFPLALPLRMARWLVGFSNRKLTRPGMLESHYEKYLYGDTSLFELPETPSLHLLATNLSEGRLCSFNRSGLWMIGWGRKKNIQFDQVPMGLATVPMAVAASSAFPGFFPPMVLSGTDVGAKGGEFGRQAYTDGGVFDNLGVRMFRWLAQAAGGDHTPWDCVLVSDAGRPFEIQSSLRAGGMIRTAMRASDILMDRVWQLETETFRDTSGFAFARITEVVDPEQDPTALHPEVQRQLATVRTDLDRFSHTEISNLMRHGYCVGRKTVQAKPDLFTTTQIVEPAWDAMFETSAEDTGASSKALSPRKPVDLARALPTLPASARSAIADTPQKFRAWIARVTTAIGISPVIAPLGREATPVTLKARTLHASAGRRIWGTLLDYRDWVSYIYVPILVPILVLAPYLSFKYYEHSYRIGQLIESLAQESRDLEQMSQLVDGTPEPFVGEKAELIPAKGDADLSGYTILQDLRILDLRRWNPELRDRSGPDSFVYGYRRLKVRKDSNEQNNFRINVLAISPSTQVRFPPQELRPTLYSRSIKAGSDLRHWEVGVDFQRVPLGHSVDLVYEHLSPGLFLKVGLDSTSLAFDVKAETIELSRWVMLPEGREFERFELIRYPTGSPQAVTPVEPISEFQSDDFSILAFKLLALRPGFTYELTWFYR
jgi:predicted acylesterase/phospholipase RssA